MGMDAMEYKRERVPGKLELLFKLDFSIMLDMVEWRGGALETADETAVAANWNQLSLQTRAETQTEEE